MLCGKKVCETLLGAEPAPPFEIGEVEVHWEETRISFWQSICWGCHMLGTPGLGCAVTLSFHEMRLVHLCFPFLQMRVPFKPCKKVYITSVTTPASTAVGGLATVVQGVQLNDTCVSHTHCYYSERFLITLCNEQ